MDFSAQLNELQQHAAAANDAVKAAAGESRDQVKQRLDMAQADLATAGKNMGKDADKAAADAKSKWNKLKADMSAHHKDVKMRMDKMAGQVDATMAEADAEWAEDDARYAALNAIDARAYADALAANSK
jgi:hypothetical protein